MGRSDDADLLETRALGLQHVAQGLVQVAAPTQKVDNAALGFWC